MNFGDWFSLVCCPFILDAGGRDHCSHCQHLAVIVCEWRGTACDSNNDSAGSQKRDLEGSSFKIMKLTS